MLSMRSSAAPMRPTGRDIDVATTIDDAPIGRFQRQVFVLCALISMLDGFDTQAIVFTAPSLAADWKVSPASFGPLFSATLLGSLIGVLIVGRLSDRYGRRWATIATVALFGLATLSGASAHSVTELILYRLLAGFGLGGVLPNFMALAAEYAPHRRRSSVVVMTLWGFPLGAVLGGLLSSLLVARFGWRSVFIAGGTAPLLLVPLLIARLPESIRYLAMRPEHRDKVLRVLRMLFPSGHYDAGDRVIVPETNGSAGGFRLLFARGRAAGTVLFAIAMFMSLLLTYLLLSWIPLLLRESGMSLRDALFGSVIFNFAGIVGSFVFTRRVDELSRPLILMIAAYCAAAAAVASIGLVGIKFWPVAISVFVAGFLLVGIQMTLSAFVASKYPTNLRATAVGWVQGVGRFGSLLGPLAAGGLVSVGMIPSKLFATSSIAALLAAAALALLACTAPYRRIKSVTSTGIVPDC
jgi:MFS transporter, AAHS family, 4-hydroxybenzoate transporter